MLGIMVFFYIAGEHGWDRLTTSNQFYVTSEANAEIVAQNMKYYAGKTLNDYNIAKLKRVQIRFKCYKRPNLDVPNAYYIVKKGNSIQRVKLDRLH